VRVTQRIGEPAGPRREAPASVVDIHGVLNTSTLVSVDSDGAAILGQGLVPASARPQIGSISIPDESMNQGVTAALGSGQRLLQELLVPYHVPFPRLHPREPWLVSPLGRAPESAVEVLDGQLYPRLVPREAG
jgi:hypothetical protein